MSGGSLSSDVTALPRIVEALRAGGVVLLPTDTVLGLATLPHMQAGVDRLYALKDRPRAKALPIMVAAPAQLADLGVILTPAIEQALASPFVPGALTIAAEIDPQICPGWLAGRREIAFRIPDAPLLLKLLRQVGPLLVTSANRAGHPTPATASEVLAQLMDAPDWVVEGPAGADVASTLINCTRSPAVIERLGAISKAQLAQYMQVSHG
jgi:L-threonylcarbamoyladenylate synthase